MSRAEDLRTTLSRSFGVMFVAALIISLTGQFLPASVSANGQISNRSITMGSSVPGAATTYSLSFKPATNAAELIIDFCSNDPLPGDDCDFSAADVPTVAGTLTSSLGTAVGIGSGSPVHTIKVTGLTMTANTTFTINFTAGITNPTDTGPFYARVLTYGSTKASEYTPASTSGGATTVGADVIDYGGIALTTNDNIKITSKVFETLSYCVFQSTCGTPPDLSLGDASTGALSDSQAYVNNNGQYTIATNAANGATVAMRGTTLCRSSTASDCNTGSASASTITSIGGTEAASTTGGEQFGMCADTTGATGGLVANAPYDDDDGGATPVLCHTGLSTGAYTGSSLFGFDDNTSTGTNSAGGSTLMHSTGPIQSYTGTFAFLGNISTTTEAGIYTTSLNTVATGTF